MRTALIVSDDIATMAARARTFRRSGFETTVCEGPASHECPRLWDQPCTLRDEADVAVIEVSADHEGTGADAARLCTATAGIHGTVIVNGSPSDDPGVVVIDRPFKDDDLLIAAAAGYLVASLHAKELP
jgi:hypothetical protein